MSPSPDRSNPSIKSPLTESVRSEEPNVMATGSPQETSLTSPMDATPNSASSDNMSDPTPLIPKRPLMRPVNRPQPPAQPPVAQKPNIAPKPVAPSPVATPEVVVAGTPSEAVLENQEIIRQQPIPPPSEPKQYRAIGLLRGRYEPSEEQFTRGTLLTTDGTRIEAVLLGRVMSLVKNHLELEKDHLWVVYPRTRIADQDLHAQIVGVWEPEKLSKNESGSEEDPGDSSSGGSKEASALQLSSPGHEDDYFSIRGEIIFYSPESEGVIVKIQQIPRKSSDKPKAFKLQLKGVLPSEKTLGYFWDLQVKRQETFLLITSCTVIGLVPPKKKGKDDDKHKGPYRGERKSFKKPSDHRSVNRGTSPGSALPSRQEPVTKPFKRSNVTLSDD